jgi:hypothetical protein
VIFDSDLGLQDSQVSELRGSIDFYVKGDGTPVEITLAAAWTQPEGKASGTETLQLSDLGAPISIQPPTEVWKIFTAIGSGYAVASPSDWGSRERGGDRYFIGPSGDWSRSGSMRFPRVRRSASSRGSRSQGTRHGSAARTGSRGTSLEDSRPRG